MTWAFSCPGEGLMPRAVSPSLCEELVHFASFDSGEVTIPFLRVNEYYASSVLHNIGIVEECD
jgi:hypothetical protein